MDAQPGSNVELMAFAKLAAIYTRGAAKIFKIIETFSLNSGLIK